MCRGCEYACERAPHLGVQCGLRLPDACKVLGVPPAHCLGLGSEPLRRVELQQRTRLAGCVVLRVIVNRWSDVGELRLVLGVVLGDAIPLPLLHEVAHCAQLVSHWRSRPAQPRHRLGHPRRRLCPAHEPIAIVSLCSDGQEPLLVCLVCQDDASSLFLAPLRRLRGQRLAHLTGGLVVNGGIYPCLDRLITVAAEADEMHRSTREAQDQKRERGATLVDPSQRACEVLPLAPLPRA